MTARRRFLKVLSSAAVAQIAAPLGCGGPVKRSDDDDDDDGDGTATDGEANGATSGGGANSSGASGDAQTSGGGGLPSNMSLVAHVSELTIDGLIGVPELELFIGLDDDGLYAMTSICSHKGCSLISQGTAFFVHIVCKCHFSEFDFHGGVLKGPATEPLVHFEVAVDGAGNIGVDPSTLVDAAVRVPIA